MIFLAVVPTLWTSYLFLPLSVSVSINLSFHPSIYPQYATLRGILGFPHNKQFHNFSLVVYCSLSLYPSVCLIFCHSQTSEMEGQVSLQLWLDLCLCQLALCLSASLSLAPPLCQLSLCLSASLSPCLHLSVNSPSVSQSICHILRHTSVMSQ